MSATTAIRYDQVVPEVMQALMGASGVLKKQEFDPLLRHLVLLRASQINGCEFCVDMHTKEARRDGETNERLDRLVVWRHTDAFDAREKAAFAWTEALTVIDERNDIGALRERLREHFSDEEIGTLTATIAVINLWNRFRVSMH